MTEKFLNVFIKTAQQARIHSGRLLQEKNRDVQLALMLREVSVRIDEACQRGDYSIRYYPLSISDVSCSGVKSEAITALIASLTEAPFHYRVVRDVTEVWSSVLLISWADPTP